MDLITIVISLVISVAATVYDCRTGRIPNLLTLPVALFGVLYAFLMYGVGIGIGRCILLLLLFLAGMLSLVGIGDLKLIMAIGALNGAVCLAFTTLIAALGVLLVDVIKHRTDFWTDMKAGIWSLFTQQFHQRLGTGRKVKYAPYLLCGLIGGIVLCSIF